MNLTMPGTSPERVVSSTEPSRLQRALPLVTALLLGVLAYGIAIHQIGWFSDNYRFVFGQPLGFTPTLWESLQIGGAGHISAHRILNFPLHGFVGEWIGPAGAHLLALAEHLATGTLFYFLLRALQMTRITAALAAAFFLAVPWVSQPVTWWAATAVIHCTLLHLAAALCFVQWSLRRKPLYLVATLLLIFVAMLIYELFLAGFLLFWALELYLRRTLPQWQINNHPPTWPRALIGSFTRALPTLIPYVVWFLWFTLSYHESDQQPGWRPVRMLVVFFSAQLRLVHWFTDTPWRTAFQDGLKSVASVPGILIAAATIIAGTMLLLTTRRPPGGANSASSHQPPPLHLVEKLLLAWAIILASRLIFVFQGGVAAHTRHAYGAALAGGLVAAIAVEVTQRYLFPRKGWIPLALAGFTLLLLAITSAGTVIHYRNFAAAEALTYEKLSPVAAQMRPGQVLIVLGKPTTSRGEFDYYSEWDGYWLEARLRPLNPHLMAWVIAKPDGVTGQTITLTVFDRRGNQPRWYFPHAPITDYLQWAVHPEAPYDDAQPSITLHIPRDQAVVWIWQDHELVPLKQAP